MNGKIASMNKNIKTHLQGMRTVIHYYLLGVAASWGGFPIIAMISNANNMTVDRIQTFYSVFALVIYIIMAYLAMHDIGTMDRAPYKWARYNAKGLVMGAMGFAVIYIVEALFILIADRFAVIQHPIINMEGLHGYITMILYMPFFWFYKLLSPELIIPSVNYFTGLAPAVVIIAVNGFAYWMGFNEKVLLKKKPKGKVADVLFYGRGGRRRKKYNDKIYQRGDE